MSVLEPLEQFSIDHSKDHELREIPIRTAQFCELCYSPPPENKLSKNFKAFWFWFSNYCFATAYTRYTTTTFNLFIHIFKDEPYTGNIVSNQLTDFAHRIVGSIKYTTILPIKLLVYYLINLSI